MLVVNIFLFIKMSPLSASIHSLAKKALAGSLQILYVFILSKSPEDAAQLGLLHIQDHETHPDFTFY